jgi:hypothetical protein
LVIVRPAFTGIVKLFVTERESESVAVTEKVAAVALGGVPERRPVEESINQEGRVVAALQVYEPEPPDAANCAL